MKTKRDFKLIIKRPVEARDTHKNRNLKFIGRSGPFSLYRNRKTNENVAYLYYWPYSPETITLEVTDKANAKLALEQLREAS